MRSYELFARYVMPRLQGSLDTIRGSNEFVRSNRARVVGGTVDAVRRAFTDQGREVPEGFRERTIGARDVAD
jgi:limonene 1,2-monooxygenase